MNIFYKGGRGMPCGQSDKVTQLPSNKPARPNLKYIGVILFFCLFNVAAFGQSRTPSPSEAATEVFTPLIVGQKVPDEFWTKEHLFYVNGDTVRMTLEAHKGKMLVLDFWATWCSKCLLHQKEINYFKKRYADHLAVVMINSKRTKENLTTLIPYFSSERFKSLELNNFVSIVEDDYLQMLFQHVGYPSYFWINEQGILQTFTFRNLLDSEYQTPFIDTL